MNSINMVSLSRLEAVEYCCILTTKKDNHNGINSTVHIQYTFKCSQIQNTGGLFCSGTNAFINFLVRFFDTRRETQFLKGVSLRRYG